MRIQHNIAAMNAYRNYNTNTKALSGNLEKLSSGYKINRAGDDAAGLAISEKMRAQITGLDAAQKNVKDGISLVKTAEGAMQEIQDMLNRMDYLATQSANGTYDNEVDRANLQKEVDALKTEINRIADSANFNGINLLDGSVEKADAVAASTESVNVSGMDRILKTVIGKDDKPYEVNTAKTVLDTYPGSATPASFKIDFSKLNSGAQVDSSKFAGASATVTGADLGMMTLTVGGADGLVLTANLGTDAEITITASGAVTATSVTASMWAQAFVDTVAGTAGASSALVDLNGVKWQMVASSGALTFTQLTNPPTASKGAANFSVNVDFTAGPSNVLNYDLDGNTPNGTQEITTGIPTGGAKGADTIFEITAADIQDGAKITLGQGASAQTITFKVGKDSKVTATNATDAWVIDLSDMDAGNIDLNLALSKLCEAVGTADINLKATASGTAVAFKLGVSNGGNGPTGITLIRASAPAAASEVYFDSLEKLANNFKMSYTVKHEAVAANNGLTLQIGDTADTFNQMEVSIGDMHTKAMGIADIDISKQEGAAAAVQTIKDAINYVSSVRGDLGAIQNRLEHTGNNLSVMAENIQDAESTIRDTDVANEMMSYVKNNILVQSAQAMLAQANQLPQGVLQLLG